MLGLGYGGICVQLINLSEAYSALQLLVASSVHLVLFAGVLWLGSLGFTGTPYEHVVQWGLVTLGAMATLMACGLVVQLLKRDVG